VSNLIKSYVVYGIKVNKSFLEKSARIRGCIHDCDLTKNFCPECGKPVWVSGLSFVFDDLYENPEVGFGYFVDNYDLFINDSEAELLVGFCLGHTEEDGYGDVMFHSVEMSEKIKVFCREYGIVCSENSLKTYVYDVG